MKLSLTILLLPFTAVALGASVNNQVPAFDSVRRSLPRRTFSGGNSGLAKFARLQRVKPREAEAEADPLATGNRVHKPLARELMERGVLVFSLESREELTPT
jgi:hypothetical protein